jgi:hypothetical protein
LFLTSARLAQTKHDKVIAVCRKSILFQKLLEHGLHHRMIDFPLIPALAADKVMMVMGFRNFIVSFPIPCICRDDQPQVNE